MSGHETFDYLDKVVNSKQSLPELVLLNIQMPGMTGLDVCERVRRQYGVVGASSPVMMLSAKAPVEKAAHQSLERSATDMIAKPFHPEILRKKVKAVLNLKKSGVRLAGVSVAASEALQRFREYEAEATRAKKHAADFRADCNETQVRADHTTDKAKHLEQELVSVKNASGLQDAEMLKLAKECEDMQVLMQRSKLQKLAPSAKAHSGAKCKLRSLEHFESAELNGQMSGRRKAVAASDASFIIALLASRLRLCSDSAKKCKNLLGGCLRLSVQDADHDDTTALGPLDPENSCYQLNKFRRYTRVAVSKLAMLEDAASNIGGIIDMADDEDVSTEYETQERHSSSSTTSRTSTGSSQKEMVGSTIASI
eukprot:TRINITY_DN11702_c0_g4_i1.p1 TRINITY_DN11702_c0_g4~~TRINITY_DN11702_c0_g4_i1.p1  ORF type:complete len:424 (+),score=79.60 TRINITY_DN11702_c0_g4_i1:171-1274(+)